MKVGSIVCDKCHFLFQEDQKAMKLNDPGRRGGVRIRRRSMQAIKHAWIYAIGELVKFRLQSRPCQRLHHEFINLTS